MTTPINKLEPAFPRDHRHDGHNGMTLRDLTLRDYFAAKAMSALITCAPNHGDLAHCMAATDAYRYADAMLKKRSA